MRILATSPLTVSDDQDAPAQPLVIVTSPELVTVPNVEIVEVGENWETSTGIFSFDQEDLISAIASQDDPGVRTPIIKLGHTDIRFNDPEFHETGSLDGQPALGKVENLRLTNNGMTLVGDYVGVPRWLAEIMPSAYPRRSFEGRCNYTTSTGNKWAMTVDAVALLGTAYPAINTLEDIQALYGDKAPTLYPVEDAETTEVAAMVSDDTSIKARKVEQPVKWRKKNGEQAPEEVAASEQRVAASASVDDVRLAFYDSLGPAQMWWWIRQILVSPQQLVVDDDEGGLWTIDFTVDSATDTVTFGDPVAVKVEYVAAAKSTGISRPGQLVAARYSSAETAGARPRGTLSTESSTEAQASEGEQPEVTTTEGEQPVKLTSEALAALGLPEDASEADISAAIVARGQTASSDDGNQNSQPQTPATDPTAQPATATEDEAAVVEAPEGMVLVDAAQWDVVQRSIAASDADRAARRQEDQRVFIEAAVREGKFPHSRMEHYTTLMSADPEGTRQLIGSMQAGLIPVQERSTATGPGSEQIAAESAYPDAWKATVAATSRRVGVGSRITNAHDKVGS